MVVMTDAASHAGRIRPGERLLVVITDGGGGWEFAPGGSWIETERPIDDALKAIATRPLA
jgi:hypothetical protein